MDGKSQSRRHILPSSLYPMAPERKNSATGYADSSQRRRTEDRLISGPRRSPYNPPPNRGLESVFSDRTPHLSIEHAIVSDRRRFTGPSRSSQANGGGSFLPNEVTIFCSSVNHSISTWFTYFTMSLSNCSVEKQGFIRLMFLYFCSRFQR